MNKCRIILTGFLAKGVDEDEAAAGLARLLKLDETKVYRLFDGKPHPIKRDLLRDKAEHMQQKLAKIGVLSELEMIEDKGIMIEAVDPATVVMPSGGVSGEGDMSLAPMEQEKQEKIEEITCPKCGHIQLDGSPICGSCGIVFSKYQDQPEGKLKDGSQTSAHEPRTDEKLMRAFVGENQDVYMRKFAPFEAKQGKFTFSWHWPAVFAPFLWAMYRKLWGWAAIIWFCSTLVPMLISINMIESIMGSMGNNEIPDMGGMWMLNLLNLVLWLVWPFTVSYIYYVYAKKKTKEIGGGDIGAAAEQLAHDQGGVSNMGMVIGIVFNIVASMILMASFTSRITDMSDRMVGNIQDQVQAVNGEAREFVNQRADDQEAETLINLQSITMGIKIWAIQAGVDSADQITRERLEKDAGMVGSLWLDAWGNDIRLSTDYDSYQLQSAGPDGVYGNQDDLILKRNM